MDPKRFEKTKRFTSIETKTVVVPIVTEASHFRVPHDIVEEILDHLVADLDST